MIPYRGEGPVRRAAPAPVWIMVATSLGITMDGIDTTGIVVANPAIAAELGADLVALQWITNGYLLAMAVTVVAAGKIGDRYGHKRVFLIGLVGFAVSSAMVGAAPATSYMIFWRVGQGLFGAVLAPTSLAILRLCFSRDQLKTAIGLWAGMFALATALGPIVAGLVVEALGWRWIFYLNLVVAAVSFAVGSRAIPELRGTRVPGGLDLRGVLVLGGGLGSLVWGVLRVAHAGWGDLATLLAFALAAGGLLWFVIRSSRLVEPLVPLGLFRVVPLSAGATVVLLTSLAMFGVAFYLALYLQHVRDLSPAEAGLALTPLTALFVVGAPAGGVLNRRWGPRVPLLTGLLLAALSMAGLAQVSAGSPVSAMAPFLALLGLGMGLVMPTATEVIVSSAPPARAGVAGGLQHTAAMLGTVLGVAVLGTVISLRVDAVLPDRLAAVGGPPPVAAQVTGQASMVAQGVLPIPPGTSSATAERMRAAAEAAFADGMRTATLVALGIVLICAGLAPLVGGRDTSTPEAPAKARDS